MKSQPYPVFQIDAFTRTPFRGNPAAVCVLPELETAPPDQWMQDVAAEMNLSETAFVRRLAAGATRYSLRWFTPTTEVELCGHATLASAHLLWERGEVARDKLLSFETRFSGELRARFQDGMIWLDFPRLSAQPATVPSGTLDVLGNPKVAWSGRVGADVLLELADSEVLRALSPDPSRLKALGVGGLIVTARSEDPAYDFISRYFGPAYGIPEDPVTGSIHCALGPYWMGKLRRAELSAYQASARGGSVKVRVGEGRVELGGEAVTILSGALGCAPGRAPGCA